MEKCVKCEKEIKKGDYEISWGKLDGCNDPEDKNFYASVINPIYYCKKCFQLQYWKKLYKKREEVYTNVAGTEGQK